MPPSRYDDPMGEYQTIYASSSAYGAYLETLSALRTRSGEKRSIDIREFVKSNDPTLRPTSKPGQIRDWLDQRHLGTASLRGTFVDLGASASIAVIRQWLVKISDQATTGSLPSLRHRLDRFFATTGEPEMDLSALTSANRILTTEISRFIFERKSSERLPFDGIRYPSRLGSDVICWAIFDQRDGRPTCIEDRGSAPIDPLDPEFVLAMRRLGLKAPPPGPDSAAGRM